MFDRSDYKSFDLTSYLAKTEIFIVPRSNVTPSNITATHKELTYYLQADGLEIDLPVSFLPKLSYSAQQYWYLLPLGELRLLELTVYLPINTNDVDLEESRIAAIKSALTWHKQLSLQGVGSSTNTANVLIVDIQLMNKNAVNNNSFGAQSDKDSYIAKPPMTSIAHSFGASYFTKELAWDINNETPLLQVFSAQDWQNILTTTQTPNDLWRFLDYHRQQLQKSMVSDTPSFDSEQALLAEFMNSAMLFTRAIETDNALIKAGLQDKPNAALVTMSLAQKSRNATAQLYLQHMQQAAVLWSELSEQMNKWAPQQPINKAEVNISSYPLGLQQLLNESLFSRHELIRTLYNHPKQTPAMIESGYVIHQHSYESLGRHYLLIFYGKSADAKHNRALIKPNFAKIAQDVATRLPLAELHHVIVLGIDFIAEQGETYIDIDTWIEPVTAMTPKERRLTKQLQRMSQQQAQASTGSQKSSKDKLPEIKLNINIPARKKS